MAVAAAFTIGLMPMDRSPFQDNVVVRGEVLDNVYHRPVPGAVVVAYSETANQYTKANSAGYFYFINLPPGHYSFHALALGLTNCICCRPETVELDAGFEYNVIAWFLRSC